MFPFLMNLLKRLILIYTQNVAFNFNGKFYEQYDGVAMGSPLGSVLADSFMAKLENSTLTATIKNSIFMFVMLMTLL